MISFHKVRREVLFPVFPRQGKDESVEGPSQVTHTPTWILYVPQTHVRTLVSKTGV